MSSNVFTRLANRKAFPVEIDEQIIHVKEPTLGEISRIQKLSSSDSTGLALGLCLVDPSGAPLIRQEDRETDLEFSKRVMQMAEVITTSAMQKISDAILTLAKPVRVEKIVKN